jgi:Integrase core domain
MSPSTGAGALPPYRPRTNGKAERFIQTMLRERAYGQAFSSSQQRRQSLRRWLTYYKCRRPHSALGHNTRVPLDLTSHNASKAAPTCGEHDQHVGGYAHAEPALALLCERERHLSRCTPQSPQPARDQT